MLNQGGVTMESKLGEMELRFAEMIWNLAPVESGELVRRCADAFDWKKSTTYTMLRRLCERGLFENNGGTVEIRKTKAEYLSMQTERFVKDTFDGSLPKFLAAFASNRTLEEQEIAALQKMIDDYRGGK